MELIEKLAALIAPPYVHMTRYFGALSSHSKLRRRIILKPGVKKGVVTELGLPKRKSKVFTSGWP